MKKKKNSEQKQQNLRFFILSLIFLLFLTSLILILNLITEQKNPSRDISGKQTQGTIGLMILSRCSQALAPGWNLISTCANNTNKSIENLLSGINYRYVMRWNTTTMAYDIFSPKSSEKPFSELSLNESYFILLYSDEILSISGDNNDNMNIMLVEGWNAPSYPYEFLTNISNYLDSLENNYRYIMKWNRASQEFDIYSPKASSNPFSTISIGEGQFINCYAADILEYNRTKCLNG